MPPTPPPPPPSAKLKLSGTTERKPGKKEWSVTEIWSEKLGKPFTPISAYFIANYHRLPYPINANEFVLIVHLLKFKWDSAMPFPAISTLGKQMSRSEQAVRAMARSLEKKGYLKRHMTKGKPNHFDLQPLFRAVEVLYDEDKAREELEDKPRKRKRRNA